MAECCNGQEDERSIATHKNVHYIYIYIYIYISSNLHPSPKLYVAPAYGSRVRAKCTT